VLVLSLSLVVLLVATLLSIATSSAMILFV